eukprot:3872155-Rhodomonas_salina.1
MGKEGRTEGGLRAAKIWRKVTRNCVSGIILAVTSSPMRHKPVGARTQMIGNAVHVLKKITRRILMRWHAILFLAVSMALNLAMPA